jgi:predicted outer membrane repeat protein
MLGVILALPTVALSATWYVPDHFSSIQGAINGSADGDTIIVRPGTYVENIDYSGKDLVIKSEWGPYVTIIDGNQAGSVVSFTFAKDQSPVLEGFTIRNGSAAEGGGVHCYLYSSPLLFNNIICDNSADYGGGIHAYEICEPMIWWNIIRNNDAQVGGGIFIGKLCIAHIHDNIITNNSASHVYFSGGGIYLRENQAGGVIENNYIADNYGTGPGGGILLHNYASVALLGNTIVYNASGEDGGGIFLSMSWSQLINCVVARNTAARYGGGIYCTFESIFDITNSTIAGNQADVYGGGMYIHNSDSEIVNSIFWDNHALVSSPASDEMFIGTKGYPSTVDLSYSDVRGKQANIHVDPGSTLNVGWGMIAADPLFIDVGDCDYHILYTSPCRDAGTAGAPDLPELDFEGDPRIAGSSDPCMGADEFHPHFYCTGNTTPGGQIKGKIVGWPGSSPVGFWLGSGVIDPPQSSAYGLWYLAPPYMGPIVLWPMPADGAIILSATLPATPAGPYALPMQAMIGSELSNLCVMFVE